MTAAVTMTLVCLGVKRSKTHLEILIGAKWERVGVRGELKIARCAHTCDTYDTNGSGAVKRSSSILSAFSLAQKLVSVP